jgi:hypothetical protein
MSKKKLSGGSTTTRTKARLSSTTLTFFRALATWNQDGIQNFIAHIDSNALGLQKKSRGRPKRVEVLYDDLQSKERIVEQLQYPP